MSYELVEASKILKNCPICDAQDSFKISGFLMKVLECKNCKAQWYAGSYKDGNKWLKLMKAAKTGLGSAKSGVIFRDFPIDFWLNKNKPFVKFDNFASSIFEAYEAFTNFRQEFGQAEFKDGNSGIWFISPTLDVVATMNLFAEKKDGDYDIGLRVIDQTSMIKEKNWDKNDLFLYMIAKKPYILTEETGIPIAPYIIPKGENQGKEVKENWFYPFKDLDKRKVAVKEGFQMELLKAFIQLKPKKK